MPLTEARSFPGYDAGYRLVAQASSNNLTENLVVNGTYVARPFATVYRFEAPGAYSTAWTHELVTVGDKTYFAGGSSPAEKHIAPPASYPPLDDLELGAAIKVSLSFGSDLTPDGAVGQPPDPAAASLALYEWVGPDEFPYPAAPASLMPLKPLNVTPDWSVATVRSDPRDPTAEQTTTSRWPISPADDMFSVEMRAQTPGTLRLLLYGIEVGRAWWWDYRQGLEFSPAMLRRTDTDAPTTQIDELTFTVVPERMTGDWAAALYHGNPPTE